MVKYARLNSVAQIIVGTLLCSMAIPLAFFITDTFRIWFFLSFGFISPILFLGIGLITPGVNKIFPEPKPTKVRKLDKIEKICKELIKLYERWKIPLVFITWIIILSFFLIVFYSERNVTALGYAVTIIIIFWFAINEKRKRDSLSTAKI